MLGSGGAVHAFWVLRLDCLVCALFAVVRGAVSPFTQALTVVAALARRSEAYNVLLSLWWLQSVARAAHAPLLGRRVCPSAYRHHLDDAPRPALAEDADERCFVLVRALGGARGAARLQHILLPLRVCRQSAPCVLVGHRRALAVQQQLLDRCRVRLFDSQ